MLNIFKMKTEVAVKGAGSTGHLEQEAGPFSALLEDGRRLGSSQPSYEQPFLISPAPEQEAKQRTAPLAMSTLAPFKGSRTPTRT